MSTHEELQRVALNEFAANGYFATSLQRIADIAGVSKSSVLYHFDSKEALLDATLGPAVNRMMRILEFLEQSGLPQSNRSLFLEHFVDFVLDYNLELYIFINQRSSLVDVPVIHRANQILMRLGSFFSSTSGSSEEKMRFGIALGGAAYSLSMVTSLNLPQPPRDETRVALITILSELLTPVSAR